MECCSRVAASGCPLSSTSAQNAWNSWDQDPHNAYINAYYHYQAYVYYWNLYNSHFDQGYNSSYCECYDYSKQGDSAGYPMALSSSRCLHCPEEGYSQFTGRLKPNETQTHSHEESYDMDVEEERDGVYDCDDDDDNDDKHNFELDDRFCQFLRQSEKHRQEREKEKRTYAKLDEYIEAGKSYINPSTLPPQEQQGVKRREAMKSLYGSKAQYIMSLEASLQLHYDRNYDTRQPKFWPNIPLKF